MSRAMRKVQEQARDGDKQEPFMTLKRTYASGLRTMTPGSCRRSRSTIPRRRRTAARSEGPKDTVLCREGATSIRAPPAADHMVTLPAVDYSTRTPRGTEAQVTDQRAGGGAPPQSRPLRRRHGVLSHALHGDVHQHRSPVHRPGVLHRCGHPELGHDGVPAGRGDVPVPLGRIADIRGRRKVFLAGMVGYTVVSFLCTLSSPRPCSSPCAHCRASPTR